MFARTSLHQKPGKTNFRDTDLQDYLRDTRIAFMVRFDEKTGQIVQFSEAHGATVDSAIRREEALVPLRLPKPTKAAKK